MDLILLLKALILGVVEGLTELYDFLDWAFDFGR